MHIGWFLEQLDLFQTQLGMLGCYELALFVCERIEHAVVWMYRWQPVLIQLVLDNVDNAFHALIIVGPVAYDLLTMGKIAIGVGKIRLQFDCMSICVNR